AWKRRPFLSTSTMSPAPTLFEGARGAGSGTVSTSTEMRPCCMPRHLGVGADGPGHRFPHAPVERDVLGAIGPHLEDRGDLRGERAVERLAQLRRALDADVAEAVERGGVGEVEAVGRGDVLLEVGALALDREEVEDA